jgi:hypothetical protein
MKKKRIALFILDKMAKRYILSSNLIKEIEKNNLNISIYIFFKDNNLIKKNIFLRFIKIFKIKIYKSLTERFCAIWKFKKYLFKKEHQNGEFIGKGKYDKLSFRLFINSKIIFNLLYIIYINLPDDLKKIKADIFLISSAQSIFSQSIIKHAKKNNIPVISLVSSWDQLTHLGKVINFSIIKKYLVWNEVQKNELIKYHGIEKRRIEIIGAISFDVLKNTENNEKSIFKIYGLKKRKIIFLPAYNKRFGVMEPDAIKYILDQKDRINEDFYILIRPYYADRTFYKRFADVLDDERVIYIPNLKDEKDRETISFLLCQSDIVLSGPGTVAIEAFYFNTPVIHLGIDIDEKLNNNSLFIKFFFSDHYQYIMNKKASFFVRKYTELIIAINKYFKDKTIHNNGRMKVLKEQVHYLDGNAHKRIVNVIEKNI